MKLRKIFLFQNDISSMKNFLIAIPFSICLLALTLILGLLSGMDNAKLIAALNKGFGLNIGYFAILLFSSFLLAEAISIGPGITLGGCSPFLAPLAGAGMVCCDTAYATLSPLAGKYKKQVAIGAYTGFKLLIPAGPLIIGSSMAANTGSPLFIAVGIALALVVTAIGILVLFVFDKSKRLDPSAADSKTHIKSKEFDESKNKMKLGLSFMPFLLLFVLIVLGFMVDFSRAPIIKFFFTPIGALAISALTSFIFVSPDKRAQISKAAIERTASLIFVIGSATCLGTMLGTILPFKSISSLFISTNGTLAMYGICFALAAIFKVINGSSMATFATVPPLIAPLISAAALDTTLATYAVCLGTFIAILPNDSFFWITQDQAKSGESTKPSFKLTRISIIQAVTGFAFLMLFIIILPK